MLDKFEAIKWIIDLCKTIKMPYEIDNFIVKYPFWDGCSLKINTEVDTPKYNFIYMVNVYVHEICHWLVSDLDRKCYSNYGHYDDNDDISKKSNHKSILTSSESFEEENAVKILSNHYSSILRKNFKCCQNLADEKIVSFITYNSTTFKTQTKCFLEAVEKLKEKKLLNS